MSQVVAVSKDPGNHFSKVAQQSIFLLEGLGVEGDAHCGKEVTHLYLKKKDPNQPNLRQVHLIHQELLDELNGRGFDIAPGALGENITTAGIDILSLPTDTVLSLGAEAQIKITGLRTPCFQLDRYQKGLTKAVTAKDEQGKPVFKSGVMAVVLTSGEVRDHDPISVQLPPEPHRKLLPV